MILEAAALNIVPDRAQQFEEALRKASPIIAAATGYISHDLQRCHETPGKYVLLVKWKTLDDHIVGFRQSPAFVEWRRLIQPFFAAPPAVEHFTRVELGVKSD